MPLSTAAPINLEPGEVSNAALSSAAAQAMNRPPVYKEIEAGESYEVVMTTTPEDRIAANKHVAKHLFELPQLSTAGAPAEDLIAAIAKKIAAGVKEKARAERLEQQK